MSDPGIENSVQRLQSLVLVYFAALRLLHSISIWWMNSLHWKLSNFFLKHKTHLEHIVQSSVQQESSAVYYIDAYFQY